MCDEVRQLADLEARNVLLEGQLSLYRDAAEHMHQAFCVFDDDGRITLRNNGFADVLQLPPDRVRTGVTIRELTELVVEAGHHPPGSNVAEFEEKLWADLTDSDTRSTIVRGGRTYAVQPARTPSGNWVVAFEDITAQLETEIALRESEAGLQAILDAMPDCVKIFSESCELVHINPAGLALLQAPDLESLRAPSFESVAPEYLETKAEVHSRVMAGESVIGTYEVVGLQGRRRHVEAHAVPFRMPDGSKAHLCISRDVSERMEAHDALRRSEERLRLVQEATGLANFEAGPDGITWFSEQFVEQIGLPPGTRSIMPEEWLEIIHPDDREQFEQHIVTCTATADTVEGEFRIVRPDTGEVRWIGSRTKRAGDETADSAKVIGVHIDITKRKLAEVELRESEERLRLVQEATGLADFEADGNGLLACSDRFLEQLGLPPGDSSVQAKDWTRLVHPEDRDRLTREIEQSLEKQEEWFHAEFRIIRADNRETRWIACSTKMERDEQGGLIRTIGAHLDITERKEAADAVRRGEERLRLVEEATGLAHFEAGPNLISKVSKRFIEQTGLPPDTRSITPTEWNEIIHPDDRERFLREVARSIEEHSTLECEFRIIRPDTGETRWLYSHCKIERDEIDGGYKSIGAHLDITERKLAEEALRESEERFRLAAEVAGLGIWDYDPVSDQREWSDRLREILGVDDNAEAGLETAKACIHPADRARFMRRLNQFRTGSAERFEDSFRICRLNDKAKRWVAVNGWRTHSAGEQLRIIVTFRDVTEEKTAEDRIRWSASHDPLTRLANRALFQEELDHAIHAADESGHAVGLLMLDLDHFKQINDSLDHDAGDILLRMFAKRLRGVVRNWDTVARLGGDEFAVILPELDGEHTLLHVARAIQQRLREPFIHAGRILDSHVSIGASVYPKHGRTPEELLKNADVALYAAKGAGRGMITAFEPHMREMVQRRSMMVELGRNAISDGRVIPYYQPKLDLNGRSLIGFEALLRWRMPNGRIGMPAALEAAFEDLDVAEQISDRMIERVIADMRGWLDRGIDFKAVAVNASAAEFRRDNFAERVIEKLGRAEIPTCCFQIEVTETVFLGRGAEYLHRALALLNLRGVKIALDDFGTGYASLRHLKQFPVDIIKIDQSFVRDMAEDPGDEAIIRAVINLGRSLGIKVVAEGIESNEQERRLLELECDFGQGFLYSRAVPASRVPALVERWPAHPARRRSAGRGLRLVANRD